MTALTTTGSNLPAMYSGSELVDLDMSDVAPRRIYMVQGNSRIRNILDGFKLADVYLGANAEDTEAEKIGGLDAPVFAYILAVTKGVVHIDKDNGGKLTFLTGQPDAEEKLALSRVQRNNVWRSYHYVVKVEDVDDPVSLMLTGFTGSQTAKDVNSRIMNWLKSGKQMPMPIELRPMTKSGNGNTWGSFKVFPYTGTTEGMKDATDLLSAGVARMEYRETENVAPAVVADDDTF